MPKQTTLAITYHKRFKYFSDILMQNLCTADRLTLCMSVRYRMGVFHTLLWHLMCLAGLLQSDFCMSQRLVEVQEGPLYRVEGYPMSISCNVSGFKGPSVQNFEFSVYKPDHPYNEIGIISTSDESKTYKVFDQRVRNKNIIVDRLSGSSVLLHMKPLMAEDFGTYECSTPNTDGDYFGSYSARTELIVIKDTLKVSYTGSPSHSINEDETLQLECQVSSETFQHTHLSVTWYLRDSPIITLDRDLTVRPGAGFEGRYRSGLISMEKVEDTTYRLRMSQLQKSDSGQIYCQGQEWILDPDRSWVKIAYKQSTGSSVEIMAMEVSPDVGSFTPEIEILKGNLQEGEVLEIRCSIKVQNLPGHFFSMSWLKNGMEVAHIGPSGVLIIAKDYVSRQKEGELRVEKSTDKSHVLTLHSVRTEDQGQYQCKATQEERTVTGTFNKGQSQLCSKETVHITTKESDLTVLMEKKSIQITQGETLQITCSVSGTSRLLSVTWQHKKVPESPFNNVISLNNKGVMEAPAAQYQQRGVRTFRSNAADFILEISDTFLTDSGDYMCTVAEWNMDSSGNMKKVNFQSQQGNVSVRSIESLVSAVLKSRDTNVFENSRIQMLCMAQAPRVPLVVKWKFQSNSSTAPKDIACMLQTGVVSCGGEQGNYQLESQVKESAVHFILRLLNVSRQQEGIYQCQIVAYLQNVQKANKYSNKLQVKVNKPVSKLSLSTKSRLKLPVNSNAVLDLFVSGTFNSSRFAVTWMSTTQTLLKMDKDGVVSSGNIQLDQRINIRMTQQQTFQLTIQEIQPTESGHYRFVVEEWIEDPNGNWYSLHSSSVTIQIVVTEKAHDFKLSKSESQLIVTEGEELNLDCSLGGTELDATLHYSLSWFFKKDGNSHAVQLLAYNYDGRLQFQDHLSEFQSRLQFSRPTVGAFRLSIFNSITSDSGQYYCQVVQYQLDCKGKWELKASDTSGVTNVSVRLMESKLQVNKISNSLNVTDHREGFTVECEIDTRSSEKSEFEVTWTKSQKEGHPLTIFTVHQDGTLHSSMSDRHLIYEHPSLTHYTLTVPDAVASDNGQYQCEVVEMLQTAGAQGGWRQLATDNSGVLSVFIQSEDQPSTGTFILEKSVTHLNAKEGERFDLSCSIKVDKVDPTFHYTITWFLDKQNSTSSNILLKYNYDGHLWYLSENPQLRSRLQFYRPNARSFHLTVQNSVPEDSGRYRCKVEQYQIGCEGKWEMKGSEQIVSTLVNVQNIGSNLRVKKENHSLNITDLRAGFRVECEINSRSSEKSVFEVIWTKAQQVGSPLIIFTASQDGTLLNSLNDRGLVFGRPKLTLYTLTIPDVITSDSGQYQCEVKELLQTAAQTWRKVAVDTSGQLFVHVHTEGITPQKREDICHSGVLLGVFIPLLCLLLVAIALLVKANKKARDASEKQKASLWAENNPLKQVEETKEED